VTILNNKAKTLAFVSLLVQLNNKQSINLITSLCWSYFSRRNYFRVIHIIPFLQNIKLFLAALQVTEITANLTAQADKRTSHYSTTTTTTTTGEHKTTTAATTRDKRHR
jgi:hypothetical protein